MKPYRAHLEGRRGFLRLDLNENTIGPSPRVLEALKKLEDDDIAAYPEYAQFKEKLANYVKVNPLQLLLTNASDEAIKVVFDCYIDKKDEVILPIPAFPMFRVYAETIGAKINEIIYKKDLSFPTRKLLNSINKKTRIVVLVNPNNQIGTPIKKEDIIKTIEKAENSIILLDEVYYRYSKETCVDLINKYDNLVIVQTFSKAFGLAGLRLGYIVSNEENIRNMEKVISPYSVNMASIKAASAAIDDQDYLNWYIGEVKKGKKIIYEELKKLKIKTYPTTANFLVAYFGKRAKEIQEKLREKGILVSDRSNYPLLEGCLRITIGTKQQTKTFLNALKEVLE